MLENAFHRTVQPSFTGSLPTGVARTYLDQLLRQMDSMPRAMRQYVHDNSRRYEGMRPVGMPQGGGMSVTRNTGTEATVTAGDKTYGFQKDGNRFSITDSNGKTVSIWGDPHYTNADGTSVDIHGDSVTSLEDGTRVFLKTSNAQGVRETNGTVPTYAKSAAIVRPDGSTVFIDNITGDQPLEVSTPPYGQMPLDFIREKMNGDFKPEAYLSINSQGQWTDMNGLPLTQQSANAMRDVARTQEPLAAALASGCFAAGMFPRSLWNSTEFDPRVRNAAWYAGLSQTQNTFDTALRNNCASQIAMSGLGGDMMLQILGQGMPAAGAAIGLGSVPWLGNRLSGAYGNDDDFAGLPMYSDGHILGCVFGGAEQPGRTSPGYAAAALADHLYRDNPSGENIDLAGLRELARTAGDPRLKASAQFLVQDYEQNGTQSVWSRIETSDVPDQYDNLSSAANFRRFAESAGYGGVSPLATPYQPPMPDVLQQAFGAEFMREGRVGMQIPVALPRWMGIAA